MSTPRDDLKALRALLPPLPEIVADSEPSAEFLQLRERAHVLMKEVGRLRLGGSAPEAIANAERDLCSAEEAAVRQMFDDRDAKLRAEADHAEAEREHARLTARENATIGRAVNLLRERGPLTAGEIEALRRPGLSHNSVRPILRLAAERGLVRQQRDGHRVLWIAVRDTESPS